MKNKKERKEHMFLLASEFFENLERGDCEYGGWGQDDKRPFGNSNVTGDIAKIVGIELDSDSPEYEEKCKYLNDLYSDLGDYLRHMWKKNEC